MAYGGGMQPTGLVLAPGGLQEGAMADKLAVGRKVEKDFVSSGACLTRMGWLGRICRPRQA
jgi:hypothetical protein